GTRRQGAARSAGGGGRYRPVDRRVGGGPRDLRRRHVGRRARRGHEHVHLRRRRSRALRADAGGGVRLGARIYVTAAGFDDADGAVARRGELGAALGAILQEGLIAGYIAGSVTSEEQWDDEGVERAPIDALTGGALPVVYANITYDADDPR